MSTRVTIDQCLSVTSTVTVRGDETVSRILDQIRTDSITARLSCSLNASDLGARASNISDFLRGKMFAR
jgi:hypothetical protein